MWRKFLAPGLIVIALLPASWLAWKWRSMPHLGFYHDDSLYWVCARSLAEGHGYRIQSLPGEPFQTKYPPAFPMMLSIAWKLGGEFPANLPIAMLLVWCFYIACVASMWITFGELELSSAERTGFTIIAALNPVMILFGLSLMPEMLFITLLLAAIALTRRHPGLAGLAGGIAFLTKTAALPLLVSVPICYLLKRKFRAAMSFTAAMLPAVAAWNIWAATHMSNGADLVTLYYTNYAGFRKINVSWNDLPLFMWHNLDEFLAATGKLLTFDTALWNSRRFECLVGLVAIAGTIRLCARVRDLQYPVAALLFSLMLLVWHYPPSERFLLPLYPLLLAGLAAEVRFMAEKTAEAWKQPQVGQRLTALAAGMVVGSLSAILAAGTIAGDFRFLPAYVDAHAAGLKAQLPAYNWLARYTPRETNVFAYEDPLVFLYTGRHACSMRIPPVLIYKEDIAGLHRLIADVPTFAEEHRIDYLLMTPNDFSLDLPHSEAERWSSFVRGTPALQRVYRNTRVGIYRVAPVMARAAAGN